jgi:acyl carrier protein
VRSDLETIGHIWTRILKVDRVEEDDDFFELGGSSVEAMLLLAMIEAEISVKVDFSEFFEATVFGDLVRLIESGGVSEGADQGGDD